MARKRTEYGFDVDAEIRAQLTRGGTAPGIHTALVARGVDVSLATITRRVRELRAGAVSAPASTPAPGLTLPESPEAIPEGADESTLEALIELADREGKAAAARGDLDGFGKMGRLSVSLHEAKRKAAPLPKANPNDNPDLVKAKELARARFHKLISHLLRPNA